MPSTRLPLRLEPDVADETAIVATGASSARADAVTQTARRTTRSFKVLHCALADPAYPGNSLFTLPARSRFARHCAMSADRRAARSRREARPRRVLAARRIAADPRQTDGRCWRRSGKTWSPRPSAPWSTRADPRIARTEGAMAKAAAKTERRPASPVEHPTPKERAARGKAARGAVPRASHADWSPAADRRDPIE